MRGLGILPSFFSALTSMVSLFIVLRFLPAKMLNIYLFGLLAAIILVCTSATPTGRLAVGQESPPPLQRPPIRVEEDETVGKSHTTKPVDFMQSPSSTQQQRQQTKQRKHQQQQQRYRRNSFDSTAKTHSTLIPSGSSPLDPENFDPHSYRTTSTGNNLLSAGYSSTITSTEFTPPNGWLTSRSDARFAALDSRLGPVADSSRLLEPATDPSRRRLAADSRMAPVPSTFSSMPLSVSTPVDARDLTGLRVRPAAPQPAPLYRSYTATAHRSDAHPPPLRKSNMYQSADDIPSCPRQDGHGNSIHSNICGTINSALVSAAGMPSGAGTEDPFMYAQGMVGTFSLDAPKNSHAPGNRIISMDRIVSAAEQTATAGASTTTTNAARTSMPREALDSLGLGAMVDPSLLAQLAKLQITQPLAPCSVGECLSDQTYMRRASARERDRNGLETSSSNPVLLDITPVLSDSTEIPRGIQAEQSESPKYSDNQAPMGFQEFRRLMMANGLHASDGSNFPEFAPEQDEPFESTMSMKRSMSKEPSVQPLPKEEPLSPELREPPNSASLAGPSSVRPEELGPALKRLLDSRASIRHLPDGSADETFISLDPSDPTMRQLLNTHDTRQPDLGWVKPHSTPVEDHLGRSLSQPAIGLTSISLGPSCLSSEDSVAEKRQRCARENAVRDHKVTV